MSWIVVPLVSLAVVLSTPKDSRYRHLLPAFVVLLFSLLLMPYSMGRIDPQGLSRPGLVAIFGWTVLIPVVMWPLLQRSERAFFIVCVAGISAALQFGSLSLSSLISSVSPTVATGPLRDGKLVGLSNLGVAAVQDDHWHRLLRLNALLAGKLSPMETYLDLTNRTAHYFYLNRIPAMAVTAPYNMVPVPQQQRAIAVLSNNLPRVALLEANNILHDGGAGGLALRAPLLYRFVLDHYVPAWEDGFVVGYRHQDAAKHDNRQVRISIKDVTDNDWDSGVHRRENALLISDTFPVEGLSPGTAVQLESGTRHKITRISRETKVVWLDGPIAAPSKMGTRGFFTANIDAAHNINFQLALLDKAFSIPDLNKIPAAWGRSERSLVKRMELIKSLDGMSAANDNPRSDPQLSRLSANETQVTFDLSNSHVGGRNAGLLRFEFTCSGKKAEPKIQVFWWGDDQTGPTELSSLRFSAVGGVLIVPLDVYPRWLTLRKVLGIRINLNNAAACEVSSIRNVSLHQRTLLLAR